MDASHTWLPAQATLAYGAYLLAVASPGPSSMAIMGMAMDQGRKPALVLAAGVVSGSIFWGVLAALGLSQVLTSLAWGLIAMKVLGGAYLLWLANKSLKAALRTHSPDPSTAQAMPQRTGALYLRGLGMHLTNPKAILAWLAIVALALPPGAGTSSALRVVATCACIGATVFGGYALVFSTATARRVYRAGRRALEGVLAAVFAVAGLRLLSSATQHAP
ncbi:MAG: hypothetical protein CFE45_06725 [Burkholderiales bacterium PBB5]|nr:MAG: hypothetical protein CFE45_06725 [Burkholderiales bacterium PBB5]